MTYPLGFGTFDRFVNPPRAVIAAVTQEAGEITVRADAEMILKAGRDYRLDERAAAAGRRRAGSTACSSSRAIS